MAQIDQWLRDAFRQHQAGQHDAAETCCRRILAVQPRHVQANYLLGSLLARQGRYEDALAPLTLAATLDPSLAEAHNNLGIALRELGRVMDAVDAYDVALRARPGYAEAWNNKGTALQSAGQMAQALDCFARATELKPTYAEAHNNLGLALNAAGRPEEAAAAFETVTRLSPEFVPAHNNLGNVRMAQSRFAEAMDAYDRALLADDACAEIHSNRGTALRELSRFDEARAALARALTLQPAFPDALSNLASCLLAEGRMDEALDAFDLALSLDPGHIDARWNRSLALLSQGDWTNGWAEYECRFAKYPVPAVSDAPRWDGSPLAGRTILVCAEQGAGDTLKFLRYLPLVKARGGRVILACPAPLAELAASCAGVDQILAPGETVPHDVQIPLLSLPGVFGTTPDTVPVGTPYVAASDERRAAWQAKVDAAVTAPELVKIGLCWAGNPDQKNDHNRSASLSDFAPLAAVPGVVFFSLQKGAPAAEAQTPPPGMTLIDLTGDIHDFADTAALISALDLTVTVDTSVAHLAGAIAAPVWTLLPFAAPWHYLQGRADNPWYPGMHLFPQTAPRDWDGVFARVGAALAQAVAGPRCEALLADGEAAFARGDVYSARALFMQAWEMFPGSERALGNLAVLDYAQGDYGAAVARLSPAVAGDNASPVLLENLARCLMAQGNFAGAAPHLERALAAQPDNRELEIALAECRTHHAPLVSVVVPCYKQAHLLAEAVDSVIAQTYPRWEMIIVDDGSPDNTAAVARELIAAHPGHAISLIEKPNAGLSAARNTGFDAAEGEYFLPLDSDDALHPQFLEKTVARLQSRPDLSLTYTDVQHFGAADDVYHVGPFTLASQTEDNRMAYCALLRREMFETLGGYDPVCIAYEDWDFWLRALEQGFAGQRIAEALFRYRKTETSKLVEDNKQRERFVAEIVMRHVGVYDANRIARAANRLGRPLPPEAGPMVSVVVPAFNQAAYLEECLESLVAQTHGNWEAIIVNDGSTDNTRAVAENIITCHPEHRIRLITQANSGVGAARNTGFAAAEGDYFLPLDGDDVLHPQFLEKTMAALQAMPDAAIAFTHVEYFGGRSGVSPAGPMTLDMLRIENTVVNCCLMCRAVFAQVGGYRTAPGYEDWEFWLDALAGGAKAVGVPEPLFRYRRTAESKMTQDNVRRARFTSEIVLRHATLYHPARVAEAEASLSENVSCPVQEAATVAEIVAGGTAKGRVLLAMNWFWPHVGGEERLSEDIGASLVASGFAVEVATRWQPERTSDTYRGMTIHSLAGNAGDGFRRLVETRAPETVVIIGGPEVEFLPATLQIPQAGGPRIVVVPCVTATGYEEVHKRPELRTAFAASLARADVVVCSSRNGYDARLFEEMGVQSVYVPNAVHRTEGNGDFRAEYGIPQNAPLLLDVSNLRPEKNHDGLLHHLRGLPGDWHLVLIGCPFDPTRHVATHVQHLADLDPRVTLIPGAPPETIAAAMDAADLLLLPSHADATPLVLIEAMSHALPWIATPECGSAHDHAGGLMVPVTQFGEAIDFLLTQDGKREGLARAGFAHWQACYSYPVIGPRYASLARGADTLPELSGPADALAQTRDVRAEFAAHWDALPAPVLEIAPKASVVITTQDAAYLGLVLESYARQTLPASQFEIIVVTDGADEDVVRTVDKYAAPFALLIHHLPARRGAAFARNAGLLQARGEIVLFLADDAAPDPHFLETHVRAHGQIETPYVGVMGRLAPAAGGANSVTSYVWSQLLAQNPFAAVSDGQSVEARGLESGAASLKRAFLLQRGVFDPDAGPAPDSELAWRLKEYGLHFVYRADAVARPLRPLTLDARCARLEEKGRAAAWMARTHRDPEVPFWTGAYNAEDRLTALAAHRPAIAQIGAQMDTLDRAGLDAVAARPEWTATLLPSLAQLCHLAAEYHFLSAFTAQQEVFDELDATHPALLETNALVSVVLPCFNYARYLGDAVGSLVAQTYANWEAIIVDDGSPDDTVAVAKELIARYPERRIRLITQANSGHPSFARNRGIDAAQGTYIVCLDADDTLAPTFLAECVGLLEQNPRLSIAYTDQVRTYPDGRAETFHCGDYSVRDLTRYLPLGVFACFRKQAWADVGGWKAVGYEDWDFWLACAEKGHIGMRIARPLSGYRKHGHGKYVADEARGVLHKAWLALNHPLLFDDARRLAAWGVVESDRWLHRPPASLPRPMGKVSVVITTNGRDPLGLMRAVESVQSQTYPHLEILIAGTGDAPIGAIAGARILSTDGLRSEAEARNAALDAATGRYVAYLTTDARYAPRHLETVVGFLQNTRFQAAYADVTGDDGPGAGRPFDYQQIMAHPLGRLEGLVHERTCVDKAGPFDTSLPALAEWEFVLRLSRFTDVARVGRALVTLAGGPRGASTLAAHRDAARQIYARYEVLAAGIPGLREQQAAFLKRLAQAQIAPLVSETVTLTASVCKEMGLDPYRPCVCGSGKKLKFCHYGAAVARESLPAQGARVAEGRVLSAA